MTEFATPEDLAGFMQQDLDRASAELALSLVEAELVSLSGVAAADIPARYKVIGLRAAARLYANPTDLASEAIDDYRRGFRETAGIFTDDELAQVTPDGTVGRRVKTFWLS